MLLSPPLLLVWRSSGFLLESTENNYLQKQTETLTFSWTLIIIIIIIFLLPADVEQSNQTRRAEISGVFSSPSPRWHGASRTLSSKVFEGRVDQRRNTGCGPTPPPARKRKRRKNHGERRGGEWRAPVVSRSTSRLINDDDDGWRPRALCFCFFKRETEHTADKLSYILCLFKFNPPNPEATIPTNQREDIYEPLWVGGTSEVIHLRQDVLFCNQWRMCGGWSALCVHLFKSGTYF